MVELAPDPPAVRKRDMSDAATCSRCQEPHSRPERVYLPPELQRQVLELTCPKCWKDWLSQQTKLINEMRLDVSKPESHDLLAEHMRWFLQLPGAVEPGTQVSLPPEASQE